MTLYTVSDPEGPGQPPNDGGGESAVSVALRGIGTLLEASPLAREQFQDARHDQAEADRLEELAAQADREAADAKERVIAERHKAGPHKRINRQLGTGIAVALAVADALPAYWSAQAFNLDQRSTIMLTVLLCAALAGAMWLLDLFADKGRRLAFRILEGALGAGFAGLFVLRLDYLQVMNGEDLWSAAIQAMALTALSAALVAVGFVVLSHRVPKGVADAERTARQAAQSGAKEAAASAREAAVMSRAALEDTVVTWAVGHEQAGIGHQQFLHAISEAIGILLKR
jgi:hypothetical protein